MAKVEFIKWDNDPPMLCSGALYVKIDGKLITFNAWNGEKNDYPPFWECYGGFIHVSETKDDIPKGPWSLAKDLRKEDYTDEIVRSFPELIRIFNEHVKWGSCEGCVSIKI